MFLPPRRAQLVLWLLALGYFAVYIPYSSLTKALAQGLLPGAEGPVSGWQILPAAALGSVVGMLVFVSISGWHRYARRRRVLGIEVPLAGRETFLSAFFAALIMGATTLNYTFVGISILFMLLLMRGGVLILSPLVDRLRRREVKSYSWAALGLSVLAVIVAVGDVAHYQMNSVAAFGLAIYFVGYIGRFTLMGEHAKRRDETLNRRYFIEEHICAAPVLTVMLALGALMGSGEAAVALRHGFSGFLATEAALAAFVIGLLYEGLFIFGSLIYLDRREFTYCVPVNRGASLLSGIVATSGLMFLVGLPGPSLAQLTGAALILCALGMLAMAPALRRQSGLRRIYLFVCSGNTCRSPMAAAIGNAEISKRLERFLDPFDEADVRAVSAGVSAREGRPMTWEARQALLKLGVSDAGHRSQCLSAEMARNADLIYCMTSRHRRRVIEAAPTAREKTHCLDPNGDIEDPVGRGFESYFQCALRLRRLIRQRLDETVFVPSGEG